MVIFWWNSTAFLCCVLPVMKHLPLPAEDERSHFHSDLVGPVINRSPFLAERSPSRAAKHLVELGNRWRSATWTTCWGLTSLFCLPGMFSSNPVEVFIKTPVRFYLSMYRYHLSSKCFIFIENIINPFSQSTRFICINNNTAKTQNLNKYC